MSKLGHETKFTSIQNASHRVTLLTHDEQMKEEVHRVSNDIDPGSIRLFACISDLGFSGRIKRIFLINRTGVAYGKFLCKM